MNKNRSKQPRSLSEIATRADAPLLMAASIDALVSVAYEENLSQYERYTSVGSAPNFKPRRSVTLTTNDRLDDLNELEEYKEGKFSERSAEWKIRKWGKKLGVSYEMLIDDDFDAVRELAQNYGQIAGLTVGEFIPGFLDALPVTLDTAGVALSGPLTESLVDRALQRWGTMTNHDGQRVNLPLGRIVFNETRYGRGLRQIIRPSTTGDYNQYSGALPEAGFVNEQNFGADEQNFIYLMPDPARYRTLALDFLRSPKDARENYTSGPRTIPEPGVPRADWLPGDAGAGSEGFRFDSLSFKIRHVFGGGWREEALPVEISGGVGHRLGIIKIEVTV